MFAAILLKNLHLTETVGKQPISVLKILKKPLIMVYSLVTSNSMDNTIMKYVVVLGSLFKFINCMLFIFS